MRFGKENLASACDPVTGDAPVEVPLASAKNAPGVTPTSANICAVVVTYFPEAGLLTRLRAIQPQVGCLVVIDNGSAGQISEDLYQAELDLGAQVIRNKVNRGIAAALNQGARYAANRGYQWFLALDQDTLVAENLVVSLSAAHKEFHLRDKLAVIASNYRDVRTEYELVDRTRNDLPCWQEVPMAITSGSLFSLSAFRTIGPFREEFFIDGVDFEYCLRARRHAFKVILACKAFTQHAIGAATSHKLPFRQRKVFTANHSPLRRYYMARNQMVLAREYLWSQTTPTATMLYGHAKIFILMLLFDHEVARKLRLTALGLWDGLFGNFDRRLT